MDSSRRDWKITARPDSHGAYGRPVHWTMTAAGAVAVGPDRYCDTVRDWARSVYEALQASGNLAPD